jgi:hypothetical protein
MLFVWDFENNLVVASVGMGWDMGPPMWPYRAIKIICYAINAPAYVVCWPLLRLLDPRNPSIQYAIWFPATLILWWWVGRSIDFGLLGAKTWSKPKLIAAFLIVISLVLLRVAAFTGMDTYHWFRSYWPRQPAVNGFLFVEAAGSAGWCMALAIAFTRSALGLLRKAPET